MSRYDDSVRKVTLDADTKMLLCLNATVVFMVVVSIGTLNIRLKEIRDRLPEPAQTEVSK